VRREEVVEELKAIGGDVVLVDGPELAERVAAETGNASITLALDGVADTSSTNLMSCVSDGGALVSYGGVSRKPMIVEQGPHFQGSDDTRLLAASLVSVGQAR
jgi:NADPH:quinone reductase-like Zn-dependent oxidoreductase